MLPRPADGLPVELAVRDHWHRDEAPAHYVENTLFNALFGLLCWPAVFAPVPGAFFHPFQRGPADLGARFSGAPRRAVPGLPRAAGHAGVSRRDRAPLPRQAGPAVSFVSWDALSEPLLALALDCVPAAHLKRVFERLLSDVKTNRSGLPDLIRFWPAEKRYELVEVKGPGDKLQDNQIRWLDYCLSHGMPVSVCHVRWQDMDAAPASQERPMSCVAAVRTLCEFTARAGDLDLRFTPAPTGQEGVAGHGVVTGRRGPGYETEIALSGEYGELLVRGRADGYDPAAKRLEEIKTYRGRLDSVRENHRAAHWAQAKVYGHLLCQARGLPSLTVALVYFNVATEEETMLVETHPAAELEAFFNAQCERYLAWARQEQAHRARATRRWRHCAFRTNSAAASASWRWPPTARRAMAAACWRRRRPASAKRWAPCFRCSRPRPRPAWTSCSSWPPRAGPRAGAAGAGHAERAAGRARPAGAGAAGARQALRASGQGVPWRVLPVGARLLRPPAAGPRRRAGARPHGRRRAAPGRGGARRLPLLPGAGIDALERRGGG